MEPVPNDRVQRAVSGPEGDDQGGGQEDGRDMVATSSIPDSRTRYKISTHTIRLTQICVTPDSGSASEITPRFEKSGLATHSGQEQNSSRIKKEHHHQDRRFAVL